ncbi:MAG: hypothetical protein CVV58_03190 [Tenericutes bacterium HGW-Tenericutes-3]|nr:MAG: hypothetical protein CVV58_03190 [Tenericutes bacterium HGW-Tenericutes-3]
MKSIVMVLTLLVVAMMYTLQISQTQATSLHLHEITFADTNGDVIHTERFAEGSFFLEVNMPEAPEREGFVFVGWSYDFSKSMPNFDMIVYPQYMHSEFLVVTTFA